MAVPRNQTVAPTWFEAWGMHLFRESIAAWLRLPNWAQVVVPIAAFLAFDLVCGVVYQSGAHKAAAALVALYVLGWLVMIAFVQSTREQLRAAASRLEEAS